MDLSELRDSTREKADEEAEDFIGNTTLDRFINQGARLIHGKIAQRFNDDFVIPGTAGNGGKFSTVVSTQSYSLPTTLKKLVRAEARFNGSTSDNDWRKIPKINIANDQADPYYPPREGYPYPGYGYFLSSSLIWLRPVPAAVFEVRLWFVPQFVKLVDESDEPDIPEECHDLISEFASIQCLRKSGEGIYKEAMDLFNIELTNMLDTVDYRNQEPEQMVITDESIYG